MSLPNSSIAYGRFIHNPICYLTAPIPLNTPDVIEVRVWNLLQTEVLDRVIGLFASFAALIDCVYHIVLGVSIYFYNQLQRFLPRSFSEYKTRDVKEVFKRAAFYAALTVVGSIVGIIYPEGLKFFGFCPTIISEQESLETLLTSAPLELRNLVTRVRNNSIPRVQRDLQVYWNNTTLRNKDLFIKIFNKEEFANVREALSNTVFRDITPTKSQTNIPNKNPQVQWLSTNQITLSLNDSDTESSYQNEGYYFYAIPTLNQLRATLRNGRVDRMHEKTFNGTFVSNRIENGLGKVYLAFKKTQIERLSSLIHGFNTDPDTYWAGFSEAIPITQDTLAYIILENDPQITEEVARERREQLTRLTRQWFGTDIRVISRDTIDEKLVTINQLNRGIPAEWPRNYNQEENPIIPTLRNRAHALMAINQGEFATIEDISRIRKAFHYIQYCWIRIFAGFPSNQIQENEDEAYVSPTTSPRSRAEAQDPIQLNREARIATGILTTSN